MKERAFSLIELLAVVAVMMVVMLLIVPGFNSISDANKINEAGYLIMDQIDAARQQAAVSGSTVEVRFLKKGGDTHYTGMQLFASGTKAVGKVVALPQGVAILANNTFSPWLDTMTHGTMPASNTGWDRAVYRSYKVRSSGVIEPVPSTPNELYVTAGYDRTATSSGTLSNYATVQVSPYTGRPFLYRP